MSARAAAAGARYAMPGILGAANVELPPTTPFGGIVLYRARLGALSAEVATQACARLRAQGEVCMTVPPGG
jgi:hypothetical protein